MKDRLRSVGLSAALLLSAAACNRDKTPPSDFASAPNPGPLEEQFQAYNGQIVLTCLTEEGEVQLGAQLSDTHICRGGMIFENESMNPVRINIVQIQPGTRLPLPDGTLFTVPESGYVVELIGDDPSQPTLRIAAHLFGNDMRLEDASGNQFEFHRNTNRSQTPVEIYIKDTIPSDTTS